MFQWRWMGTLAPLYFLALLALVVGVIVTGAPAAAQSPLPSCDDVDGPNDWLQNRQPNCLAPGQKYRILFMSRDERASQSSDIDNYNNWVRTRAQDSNQLPDDIANNVKVLASTPSRNARVHTDTEASDDPDSNIPIFYFRGEKVADSYANLYDGT